jgi:hypothetical protein
MPRWAAPAIVAAVALAMVGPIGRWAATAIALALAGEAWRRGAVTALQRRWDDARWPGRAKPWLSAPNLVVLGIMVLLLHDLALGRPPASRDHGVHLLQTRTLIEELIPTGRLRGWTQSLNAGYPFGDSYPVLGYVLTGATSLITGGLVPLRVSYAWGLLAVWVLSTLAVVALGRALAREVALAGHDPSRAERFAKWVGAAAGVAWLMDPGASRQGGWNYLMFHGVWPQQLSTAAWIGGQVMLWSSFRSPSPRRIAMAALLLAGSLVAHPFGMLTVAASAVAWVPVLAWARWEGRIEPGVWRWWVLAHAGANLLAAGWLVGFFASANAMGRSPVPFEPLGSLAADLFTAELFANGRAWISVAAVLGLALTLRRGVVLAAVVALSFVGLLIAASEEAITVFGLDLWISGFKNLQFPRYTIALKPLWSVFAGLGITWLVAAWRRSADGDETDPDATQRFGLWRWLSPVLIAPLLLSTCEGPSRLAPRPVGDTHTLTRSHAAADRRLGELLVAESQKADRTLRVAFLREGMGGATYALLALTDAGADVVLDAHVPAINYRHWLSGRSVEALRALGVTHVLHARPPYESEVELADALETVGVAGIWTLSRLGGAERANPSAWTIGSDAGPATPVGGIPVEDGWRFDVPASATLRPVATAVGPYRKWRALDESGRALEINRGRVAPGLPGSIVMTRGPFSLLYRDSSGERNAAIISWVALLLALVSLGFTRVAKPSRPRLPPRVALAIVGALAIAGGLALQQVRARSLAKTWSRAASGPESELRSVRDLVMDGSWGLSPRPFAACDGLLGRDAQTGCSPADEAERVSFLFHQPYLYRCVSLTVDAGERRQLAWAGLEANERLVAIASVSKWPVYVDLAGDLTKVTRQRAVSVSAQPVQGRVVMELHNPGRTPHRTCIAAAAVSP